MKIHRLSLLMLLVSAIAVFAQERDVSKWIEIPYPKDLNSKKGTLWLYRAEQSTNRRRVFCDGQKICAALTSQTNFAVREVPEFTPEAESFHYPSDGSYLNQLPKEQENRIRKVYSK